MGDRSSEDRESNDYLKHMPLQERTRAIKGVKANCKSSHADLKCSLCNEDEPETQEHIEECTREQEQTELSDRKQYNKRLDD